MIEKILRCLGTNTSGLLVAEHARVVDENVQTTLSAEYRLNFARNLRDLRIVADVYSKLSRLWGNTERENWI